MFNLIDISTYIFYQSALTGINLTTFTQADKYISYVIIFSPNLTEADKAKQIYDLYKPSFISHIELLPVDLHHYQIVFTTQHLLNNIEPMHNYIAICKTQLSAGVNIIEEKINTCGGNSSIQNYFSILLIGAIIIIILNKRRNNKLMHSISSMIVAIIIYQTLLILVEIRFYLLGQIINHKYSLNLYLKKMCMDLLKLLFIYLTDIFVMMFVQEADNNKNNKLNK